MILPSISANAVYLSRQLADAGWIWVKALLSLCAIRAGGSWFVSIPRGSIYTTIMELAPKRPSPLWFWGPNSIIVVYMDPLG